MKNNFYILPILTSLFCVSKGVATNSHPWEKPPLNAIAHQAILPNKSIEPKIGKYLINRDWNFKWGDRKSPEQLKQIHLPHSFSLPYFLSDAFYTGVGTYSKSITIPKGFLPQHQLLVEIEAAFQVAKIYVNGKQAGNHTGGYTGFQINLTPYLREGKNIIEIEVDNTWNPQIAPRAGEHVFSGGIYRDVFLHVTGTTHIPLNGIWVQPIEQSKDNASLMIKTELKNNSKESSQYVVEHAIYAQKDNKKITKSSTTHSVPGNSLQTVQSGIINVISPQLWSPDSPSMYVLQTTVKTKDGKIIDRKTTPFGIRSIEISKDFGLKLNKKHLHVQGANVHQDRAGWGDAVSNQAFYRDVHILKQAGMNFIRGSHYPHDPAFVEACDRLGMGYMCEGIFWGMGGQKEHDQYWNCDAYPRNENEREAFESSCAQQVREMVKAFRNNPSILFWSISNEPFFTHNQKEAKIFCEKLIKIVKELDPTRPVCAGGGQRGGFDELGDFAAYNGDGAHFLKPDRPSMVSEYGSVSCKRPGSYAPGWGDLAESKTKNITYPWRMGEILWCGFDHGSIWASGGRMGIVDYFRIPKRAWYWYRNEWMGQAPPQWPASDKATGIRLTSDSKQIQNCHGQSDVHIMAQLMNKDGQPVNTEAPISFEIIEGPGEFPTGKTITFTPNTDIDMIDGSAAIEMRSYYAGISKIKASSPNLPDAYLTIETLGDVPFDKKTSKETSLRPYQRFTQEDKKKQIQEAIKSDVNLATNRPCRASSQLEQRFLANDGDLTTGWKPGPQDKTPYWELDMEFVFNISKINLTGSKQGQSAMTITLSEDGKNWKKVTPRPVKYDPSTHQLEFNFNEKKQIKARYIRVQFHQPDSAVLNEVKVSN